MAIKKAIVTLLLCSGSPLFSLRVGNVYTAGNALKAAAAPANRLTLADFRRASLRIRYSRSRQDTVYAGLRFARLIVADWRSPPRRIDRLLHHFRPGQLAAALHRINRKSSRPVIMNLAGIRYRIDKGVSWPLIAIPRWSRKGPVLRMARIAAYRLARSASGRSPRFGYADLRRSTLTLNFTNRRPVVLKGAGAGRFLCAALQCRNINALTLLQLARGLQTAANLAGSVRLQVFGQPPVTIISSELIRRRIQRDKVRAKQPLELITHLQQVASRYKYIRHRNRFLPGQLKDHHYMDCDDFALYAWQLFYENGHSPAILTILNPLKKGQPAVKNRDYHAICAYEDGGLWHSVDFGPGFRSFRAAAPDISLLPALLYGQTVRYTRVNVHFWRRGEKDPELQLTNTRKWLISVQQ